MKTHGILTSKEKFGRNYKLTFKKGQEVFFLILHGKQQKIYNWLKENYEYFFISKKGQKDYYFINPQSIKLTIERKELTSIRDKKNDTKDFYYSHILKKELKIKGFSAEEIRKKLEADKEIRKILINLDKESTLELIKNYIYLIFLKNRQLGGNDELEKKILEDIGKLFYFHRIWDGHENGQKNPAQIN
jgi:hypothetical protein